MLNPNIGKLIKNYDNNDTVIVVTSGVNLSAFICLNFGIKPSGDIPMLAVPSCSPIGFNFDKEKFNLYKAIFSFNRTHREKYRRLLDNSGKNVIVFRSRRGNKENAWKQIRNLVYSR